MAPVRFAQPKDLLAVGEVDLGASSWSAVNQGRIDTFADATDDHQWIHVDPARAATGPFGTTIAHGFLTLSLAPRFLPELIDVPGAAMVVNYGLARVRFPAPVPVESKVRGLGRLLEAEQVTGGVQATIELTVEVEGAAKPGCVAQLLLRYLDAPDR